MSKPRRMAVSYSRFSARIQETGDSQDRQDRLFKQFCELHNLTPLPKVYRDPGRSGYKDEHRKKGRLGELIAHAKDGHFEPGTIIVVEAWDRLGRLRPDRQIELVKELLRTGVAIGVCRLNDIFTEDDFGSHKWISLAVFIQLAYQESKQKADRLADSWEKRRQQARESGRLVTTTLPAWLEVHQGKARLIPERAAVLKRIFKMAAEGFGHTRIVRILTAEKIPPFGTKKWTKPYLGLLLNDRRTLGEFQPKKLDPKKRHDKTDERLIPEGQPIRDYFPAVVTELEFTLARQAQESRLGRDKLGRVLAARQVRYVNTFKGLLHHARDGEGFILHNKGSAAEPRLLLKNQSGESGRGDGYTFPYPIFEKAVLALLKEVSPADVLPKKESGPSRADVLREKLANVRQDIAGYQEDLRGGYSRHLAALLREREQEEIQVASELQECLARAARPLETAWGKVPTLVDLIDKEGDEARLRLRTILRQIVAEGWLLIVPRGAARLVALQLYFTEGACRSYLILHQPAGRGRGAGCWADSLAKAALPGDLDLRQPEGAAKLEPLLSAVDLETLRAAMTPLPGLNGGEAKA